MAVLGLSHTYNTKVGNDFVRGVSGGERKRVSVAEMLLAGAPFAAWDNSTRGLDSATALKFVKALRVGSDLTGGAAAVAIYQASQSVYDCFDKAAVLYEGRQIYFGPAHDAKAFFERQGWYCPPRQTTGDFLTAVTNPQERQAIKGMENKVPRTPEDFEKCWRESPEYQSLLEEINDFEGEYPLNENGTLEHLRAQKNFQQAKHARPKSPYLISVPMQVKLNTKRAYQRIWGDVASTATQAGLHLIIALIVGSIYFGHSKGSSSFQGRGSVLFLAILFNALTSIGEISGLYSQRPIVEKHNSYAFYHPATEAIAGIVADIPVKFVQAVVFNIVLYFLAGLRYEAGQFFLFFIVTYLATFIMAAIFRTTAAVTQTASQAMAGAGVLVLVLVIYTGFVIRIPQMPVYFGWIRWINPIFYAVSIADTMTGLFTNRLSLRYSWLMNSMELTSHATNSCLRGQGTIWTEIPLFATLKELYLAKHLCLETVLSKYRTTITGRMCGETSESSGLSSFSSWSPTSLQWKSTPLPPTQQSSSSSSVDTFRPTYNKAERNLLMKRRMVQRSTPSKKELAMSAQSRSKRVFSHGEMWSTTLRSKVSLVGSLIMSQVT